MGLFQERSRLARSLYQLEKKLVWSAAATVSVIPGVATYFEEQGLHPRNLTHIPNAAGGLREDGPRPSHDQEDNESAGWKEIRARQNRGGTVLVYAGSLGVSNGVDTLVRSAALSRSAGVHLVVIGDGPQRAHAQSIAHELDASNVVFLGQLPKPETLRLLSISDGLVFHLLDAPVFRYGLSPNKLVDYLASGRPIVYAGPTTINPVSAAGTGLIAVAGDAESIAEAMVALAELPQEARVQMGRRGYDHVFQHHSIEVVGDRFAHLLEAVVDQHGSVRR
jgi:glycosyltransferase involved in cell wall biosynthesis